MTYQTSVPVAQHSYPSSGYGDDLAIAALWLGLAQNDSTLVSQAKGHFDQFQLAKQLPDSVFTWDSPLPGIPILGTQIYRSYPQLGGNGWHSLAEAYLDRLVSGNGRGVLTKGSEVSYPEALYWLNRVGGLLYYKWSPRGTLNPAINAAVLLRRFAMLATSERKASVYRVTDPSSLKVDATHPGGLGIRE